MKKKLTLFGLFLLGALLVNAQDSTQAVKPVPAQAETDFTPSGKVLFEVHGNFHINLTTADGEDETISGTAMEATRAYLGYSYQFKPAFSTTIMFDVNSKSETLNIAGNEEQTTGSDRFVFLKTASLNYKKNNLAVDMGLIGLYQHKVQEKYWGHRYIYKSALDQYKMSHSADVGVLAKYSVNDIFMVDAVIRNGEGYKHVQDDKKYVIGGGLSVEPMEGLMVRMFYDVLHDTTESQSTLATFVGFKKKEIGSFGVEYNIRMNQGFNEDDDRSVVSLYGTYFITEKYNVFARFDNYSVDVLDDTFGELIFGFEMIPFKQINTSLNFRTDLEDAHAIFLNLRVKI